MDTQKPPFLQLKNIYKTFGTVQALKGVTLNLYSGQVVTLVGENGAGKSTIVKILTGIYQPDLGSGKIIVDRQAVLFSSPKQATDFGITAIHQETVLFDELSVTENIFMGHHKLLETSNIFLKGTLDWFNMHRMAQKILDTLESSINPQTILKNLSIGQRHMVAIARALAFDVKVVIFDEPTAALSHHEIQELYKIVLALKKKGCAILFISHKFDEIFAISDRYAVYRDGKYIQQGLIGDVSEKDLIALMVGRSIDKIYPMISHKVGKIVLSVKKFSHPTEFNDINFELHKGEILGWYGLVGAGRTEIMQRLFGVYPKHITGNITLDGQKLHIKSPAHAIAKGIIYVPEDRQAQGIIWDWEIFKNITLPQINTVSPHGVLNAQNEYTLADTYAKRLQVKAKDWNEHAGNLSGGNQQKVVIAKSLATNPKIIILDEPTKGIDIGSKSAVHQFIAQLIQKGLSVILISSELPEVMAMSHRLIVMHEGRQVAEYKRSAFSRETIIGKATGA